MTKREPSRIRWVRQGYWMSGGNLMSYTDAVNDAVCTLIPPLEEVRSVVLCECEMVVDTWWTTGKRVLVEVPIPGGTLVLKISDTVKRKGRA